MSNNVCCYIDKIDVSCHTFYKTILQFLWLLRLVYTGAKQGWAKSSWAWGSVYTCTNIFRLIASGALRAKFGALPWSTRLLAVNKLTMGRCNKKKQLLLLLLWHWLMKRYPQGKKRKYWVHPLLQRREKDLEGETNRSTPYACKPTWPKLSKKCVWKSYERVDNKICAKYGQS